MELSRATGRALRGSAGDGSRAISGAGAFSVCPQSSDSTAGGNVGAWLSSCCLPLAVVPESFSWHALTHRAAARPFVFCSRYQGFKTENHKYWKLRQLLLRLYKQDTGKKNQTRRQWLDVGASSVEWSKKLKRH